MPEPSFEASIESGSRVLDVRPLLARGEEPFHEIMAALEALVPGQGLSIRAPFEPRPLYGVFGARGYQGSCKQLGPGDFLIEFLPTADGKPAAPQTVSAAPLPPQLTLDVRGLEPPEPLVRILGVCQSLQAGQTLKVIHERRPSLLYPRLEELGLLHRTEELAEDIYHIFITRGGGHP